MTKLSAHITVLLTSLVLGLSVSTAQAQDVATPPLTMAPYKIILNARGQADSFQGVLNMPMPAGYHLVDYDVSLLVNGEFVAQAYSFRYCYIDDNFLAEFDRQEVLNHPVIQAVADGFGEAVVEGWYLGESDTGEDLLQFFTATDIIEVLDPGRR